jgi:16S rRNA (guanine527-N7)-methyltransferase
MTEEEAQSWLRERFDVSRETFERIERFIHLLLDEADRQNLIAASTRETIWARHIVDSAQLMLSANVAEEGPWVDLGAGAGLPGIVIAILCDRPVVMIENRKGRVAFLESVIADLALHTASVIGHKVESSSLPAPAAIISARAYAPLSRLLESAFHLGDKKTLWILPKGRNWQNELDNAQGLWQGVFHVEHSVTDPESAILVGHGIVRRGRRR